MMEFLVRWLAIVSSAALLTALWAGGEASASHRAVLVGWFLIAGYLQFFAVSAAAAVLGLVLQTMLAVYLLIRAKLRL